MGCGFGSALNGGHYGGNFGGIWRIANWNMLTNINNLPLLFGSRLAHHSPGPDRRLHRRATIEISSYAGGHPTARTVVWMVSSRSLWHPWTLPTRP